MSTPLPNARKCTQSCSLPQSHLSSTVLQHSSRVVPCEDLDLILGTSSMPSTAPWTPALEPVLLATHALHALLSAALLRPATPPTPLAPSLCIDESSALAARPRPQQSWTHALVFGRQPWNPHCSQHALSTHCFSLHGCAPRLHQPKSLVLRVETWNSLSQND